MYYGDKVDTLRDLFGASDVTVHADQVVVDGAAFPIVDDVILLLGVDQWPEWLRQRRGEQGGRSASSADFAPDIQKTFGAEWRAYPKIMAEHAQEFRQYFDVVDLDSLNGKRVMDLGCGIGRWSYFLKDRARDLVLVDFSESVFVARENLRAAPNALFFLGDLTRLPFRDDCADLVVCLGVLHHLPVDAIAAVRSLARYAQRLVIYLYSALDGRPAYQRVLLGIVTAIRKVAVRIESPMSRAVFTWLAALLLYWPAIGIGHVVRPFRLARYVPLYDFYHDKSGERIRQDVYDRFFTRIEQRVSRPQIRALADTFVRISISDQLPQWHFLCERAR